MGLIVLYILIPTLILYGERRVPIISFFSPAFFCYLAGIILGNIIPPYVDHELTHNIIIGTVLIAIPLLLFSTDMRSWFQLAPVFVKSYVLYLFAILFVVSIVFYLFEPKLNNAHQIAGMSVGVYVGGTANLAAIGTALEVPELLFVQLNLIDLFLSGLYLMILLTVAQKILNLFLPASPYADEIDSSQYTVSATPNPGFPFWNTSSLQQIGIGILCSMIVIGISVGMSFLFYGETKEIFILISLTLLGLAASQITFIRTLSYTYETGQYIFLIFCFATGILVDISQMTEGSVDYLIFMASVVYGTLLVHMFLCSLFRIDTDTALTTSTAGIFGPPFIGPLAQALKNRAIVPSGMILGIIGLALGNLLGVGLAWWFG